MNKKILSIVAFSFVVAILISSIAVNATLGESKSTGNPAPVVSGEIRVFVKDAKYGYGITGALVTARNGLLIIPLAPQGNGYYYGSMQGTWKITAYKIGYYSNSITVTIPPGSSLDKTISLTRK